MYLMRLDDASEHWNKDNWHRMHDVLARYSISPIFAIIPDNTDPELLKYSLDEEYDRTVSEWIAEGWTPFLHGFNHFFHTKEKGINPVNDYSEFAGLSLEEQREKIGAGYRMLSKKGIPVKGFIAPAHTFDDNTIEALRLETDIRVISDTVANDVYYHNGFYYIPQQSGRVRKLPFRLTTFCLHPNTMDDAGFAELEAFLKKYSGKFVGFDDIKLKKRKKSLLDKALSYLYFHK